MITERDYKVVEFLTTYKIATTDTIAELFYPSIRVAQNRLKTLTEQRLIRRERLAVNNQYTYFIKRPKQFRHALAITDFYRELHSIAIVSFFIIECDYHNIRPDAVFGYHFNGEDKLGILEVELSNKTFDFNKYSDKNLFDEVGTMPVIIINTDKKIKLPKGLPYRFELLNFKYQDIRYHLR